MTNTMFTIKLDAGVVLLWNDKSKKPLASTQLSLSGHQDTFHVLYQSLVVSQWHYTTCSREKSIFTVHHLTNSP